MCFDVWISVCARMYDCTYVRHICLGHSKRVDFWSLKEDSNCTLDDKLSPKYVLITISMTCDGLGHVDDIFIQAAFSKPAAFLLGCRSLVGHGHGHTVTGHLF